MLILDTVSRIVHVATAIILVGGSTFILCVLLPSAKQLSDDAHQQLATAINGRWKKFVHGGIALFLISGFYNYFRAIPNHKGDGLYHGLLGAKMLVAFVVFFLAAALVGRSEKLAGIRANKAKWLKVVVLLAAIIVSVSGFLKIRGSAAQAPESAAAVIVETSGEATPVSVE
ncbi:hypothetical protein SAMN06265222_1204 [Neorhodopirellula lusitana]|uniref:Uncharacterized protein n=1 Tax=Neorhodopirellula lusitana TaxID=445327 RepID=A0ABY1QPX2_9BACT|nr:hypothetical protein [Neorhodopirellula lusitana]SMP75764.1 hypothetical protein SAMN06265222_1204 [Neorhodopirellula lusitana]